MWPAIGVEHSSIKLPMSLIEPVRTRIVEIGQRTLLHRQLGIGSAGQPGIADADQVACSRCDGFDARVILAFGAGCPREREGLEASCRSIDRITGNSVPTSHPE